MNDNIMESESNNKRLDSRLPRICGKAVPFTTALRRPNQLPNNMRRRLQSLEKYVPQSMKSSRLQDIMSCGVMKLQSRTGRQSSFKLSKLREETHYISAPTPEIYQQAVTHILQEKGSHSFSLNRIFVSPEVVETYIKARELERVKGNEVIYKKKGGNSNEPVGFSLSEHCYVSLFRCEDEEAPMISHSNIMQASGLLDLPDNKSKYYISNCVEGSSLSDYYREFGYLPEETVKLYFRQILLGVHHLHHHRMAHNRLSLDSIYLDSHGVILINNFQRSTKPVTEIEKNRNTHFYSPESLLSKSNNNSQKNDIWAIGCIGLQMLSRNHVKYNPYHPYNRVEMSDMSESLKEVSCIQQMFIRREEGWLPRQENISAPALEFVSRCMSIHMEKRPTVEQLLLYPFFK